MRTTTLLRAAVPTAAALTLLLTGCGPDETTATGSTTSAPATATSAPASHPAVATPKSPTGAPSSLTTASASKSAAAPAGDAFPGALAAGAQANGVFTDHQQGDISLAIGPVKVVKGDIADLAKFDLKPDQTAGKTPYYVSVSYTHTGGNGIFEPYFNLQLRAMLDAQNQAPKLDLLSSFPKCSSDVPVGGANFVKGQTEHECAVYLAPSDKPITYILWMNKDNTPLAWKAG
ncbi:hypothetical protein OG500_10620 [Kitasatospora sp. NBC_01250]|uniref:hypothetical protein n=1 Tax=unclassified Kitasatospora TaxID=2633591 RepID=UPI002E0E836A|nr:MULTISPECIES: hypothetical protein [unclassified Kitasatospora]WSJ66602.1 hypothetical protein OG294_10955 [Kitasatospora sp. NBC_01302]